MARKSQHRMRNVVRVIVISGLLLFAFFFSYLAMTRSFLIDDASSNIQEIALQMNRNLTRTFERRFANLRLNAAALASQEKVYPYYDKRHLPELEALTHLEGYTSSFLIDAAGFALANTGEVFWALDYLREDQIGSKEEIILPPGEDQGELVYTFIVPIYQGGRIVGALGATSPVARYNQAPNYLSGWGEYFVRDSAGGIVMRDPAYVDALGNGDARWLDELGFFDRQRQQPLEALMNVQPKGSLWGRDPNGDCFFAWEPIPKTDGWQLLLRVPGHAVKNQANVVLGILSALCALLLLVFVFSFMYLQRLRSDTRRELVLERRLYATLTHSISGLLMVAEIPGQDIRFYHTQNNQALFETLFQGVKQNDFRLDRLSAFLDAHVPSPGHFDIPLDSEGNFSFWYRSPKDGQAYLIRANFAVLREMSGNPESLVVHFEDISDQANREHDLISLAQIDGMTRLFNKKYFEKQITDFLASRPRGNHALILLDLDNFKTINDTCGHAFADTLLAQVADGLRATFRDGDLAGRIGGDEFAVFMRYFADLSVLERRMETLVTSLYRIDANGRYQMSVSCGASCCPADGTTYAQLQEKADKALYIAKANGRNNGHIYQPEDELRTGPDEAIGSQTDTSL